MPEKKITRIPLSEGEMTMLVKLSCGQNGVCTFGIPSGALILPAPRWALEALAKSRGVEIKTD
jgi:hypothetical protein